MDAVAAKEFLISKVVREAELSRTQLSDTEKKMLYFTEAHPSLPDILDVNSEFEREYDADEYENKIAQFLRSARERDSQLSPSLEDEWKEALDALKKEDHYILVMTGLAFRSTAGARHRFRDFLVYIILGIAFVLVLLWWSSKH